MFSCASNKVTRDVNIPAGQPLWLYAPADFCGEKSICASTEGKSFAESDARGLKALASIFEMRIQGEFKFSKHSFSGEEQAEMQEYIKDQVSKKVDLVLQGAEVSQRYSKDGLHYSLALLDRNKARSLLQKEIREVNDQLVHFFKQKRRIFIKKLNILLNQQQLLNEKLIIVDRKSIASPVTFRQINQLKFSQKKGARLRFEKQETKSGGLQDKIQDVLTEVGFQIVKNDDHDYLIQFDLTDKEEFINVKGFQKFSFTVKMLSKNIQGKTVGQYTNSIVASGRNRDDAFLKVKKKLAAELEKNIDKLNLK